MINVDNKVKNIYYMLCYTFYGEKLNEKEEVKLGSEAFDNIYDLFSLLLCLILRGQIKKGLYKDYNDTSQTIVSIKGKMDVNETIRRNLLIQKRVACEFDEYNTNCLLNQVIKTTIYYLIKSKKIVKSTKIILKKLSVYFNTVDLMEIKSIRWDQIQFNRNNASYKNVVDLCELILNGLIITDQKGKNKFRQFLDDTKVSKIYENFIKAYYRKYYPELNATSRKLYLTNQSSIDFIPMMKTDITLEYNGKMLIIDAKFYSKILNSNYLDPTHKIISNDNLYQILAYVDNQDPYKTGNVYGMLLYAQTINEPTFSLSHNLNNHKILIETLDMNGEWEKIKERLNCIAEEFKSDDF